MQDPDLVILSPECRTEAPLRHLSDFKRDPEVVAKEKKNIVVIYLNLKDRLLLENNHQLNQ